MLDNPVVEMMYKRYLELLQDDEYLELYDYYSKETAMDILGVARQENPHSSFIRWILDIHGGHGMGEIPMRKFLQTVCLFYDKVYYRDSLAEVEKAFWNDKDNIFSSHNQDFLNKIRYGRYDIAEQSIAKELVLQGQRRADIFAVLKLRMQDIDEYQYLILLIENKVHSQEHTDASKGIGQTESYVEDLSDRKKLESIIGKLEEPWINSDKEKISSDAYKMFVYLNASQTNSIKKELQAILDNRRKKKDSVCFARSREFISLNYQYLLDGIIEPTFKMTTDSTVSQRLNDYIRCLGQARISAVDERRDERKQLSDEYLIMAVSGREKFLAQSLWHKYYDVICWIIESMGPNSGDGFAIDENDRDFWISLSNLYRMIDLDDGKSGEERQARSLLKKIVEGSNRVHNSRKHKYVFQGNEYESFKTKTRTLGLLCRDIIADYIIKTGETAEQQKEALIKLRNEVLGWHLNWLREVILFDDEVDEICRNDQCNVENCKYHTNGIEDFAGAFFSYLNNLPKDNDKNKGSVLPEYDRNYLEDTPYPLEIKMKDGKKAYVAKFWTSDGLKGLIQYLDSQGEYGYRDMVEQKY